MKVVIAIDSLKGSLSSMEAGNAIKEGIIRVKPDAKVIIKPLADGGEGTTDALIERLNGKRIDVTVTGPLGSPISAYYGYLKETNTAIIEMASAAGITLAAEKNPLAATTYGGGGQALSKVAFINTSNVYKPLSGCHFQVACDVTNPLCGPNGATYVYGPQKGVTEETKDADIVVTGEGRLDCQTAMGKAPVGVARLAKQYGAVVIAFAGGVTKDAAACNDAGIDAFFPIVRGITSLEEAMEPENASSNMMDSVEQVFRLL